MSTGAIVLICVMLICLIIGVPIAWSLLISSMAAIWVEHLSLAILVQRMFTSMDSFSMLAVPLFLVAGDIMAKGSISKRLVMCAESIFGGVRGGMAIVAIVGCTIFAALTGSSLATTAAIGAVMFPAMKEKNYPTDMSSAVMSIGGTLGPVIPPSVVFIFYAQSAGLSVVKLFMSGVGPGLLSCGALCLVSYVMARKYKLERGDKLRIKNVIFSLKNAILALLMPLIILGGIYSGIFTATESAAVAVIYGLVVSVLIYKDVKIGELLELFKGTAKTTGNLMVLIASANVFGYLIGYFNIPDIVADIMRTYAPNATVFLLISGIILLIAGMFMEAVAIVVVLVPILHPLALSFGIDPIQFAAFMVFLLCLGMATPPFAPTLYLASGMTKTPVAKSIKKLIPFILVQLVVAVCIAAVPALTTWLPNTL